LCRAAFGRRDARPHCACFVLAAALLALPGPALAAGDANVSAGALAREVLTVPITLGANDLLAEMRRRRAREALVIDEHGGTAGLVTFESLMERIIGEIPG